MQARLTGRERAARRNRSGRTRNRTARIVIGAVAHSSGPGDGIQTDPGHQITGRRAEKAASESDLKRYTSRAVTSVGC